MKKSAVVLLIAALAVSAAGCGKKDENIVAEPGWESVDGETGSQSESGGEPGDADGENAAAAGMTGNAGEGSAGEKENLPAIEGIIKEQSFETELDGWGKVYFISAAPENGGETPRFLLARGAEVVYTFPEDSNSPGDKFETVSAVAFQDYNKDGKKDVIALVSYSNGESRWNEPRIFLQENSDNMFYLDHPELESYRVEGKAQDGASFYRDTFLEEYLSAQGLTECMADLSESWADYVEYADNLSGVFSAEKQIELFAKNKPVWAQEKEYANDRYCFTVAGMDNDGRPVLIVANQGGTGNYTYSDFYKIDKKGELQKLETSFREGDSQPDIMEESMTVYSSFSADGIRNHFIVYDMLKDSPGTYLYRVSSLCVSRDYVLETPLASQRVVYEGEDYSARTESEDCNGNALTEEEYNSFADTYYEKMGLTKMTATFKWIDVNSLSGMSDEEAVAALTEAYEGFSMK